MIQHWSSLFRFWWGRYLTPNLKYQPPTPQQDSMLDPFTGDNFLMDMFIFCFPHLSLGSMSAGTWSVFILCHIPMLGAQWVLHCGTDLCWAEHCPAPPQLILETLVSGRQSQANRRLAWLIALDWLTGWVEKPLLSLNWGTQSMELAIRICQWGRSLEAPWCLWIELSTYYVVKYRRVPHILKQGFSTSALLTSGAGLQPVVRGCAVHCRVFSSIPGLYPRDARSTPFTSSWDNHKCLQTLPNVCNIMSGWELL